MEIPERNNKFSPAMKGRIVFLVSALQILLLPLIAKATPRTSNYGSKSHERIVEAGDVHVFHPDENNDLLVHVLSASRVYKFQLQYAPPIQHQEIHSIYKEDMQRKGHVGLYKMEKPDPEIQQLDQQFFHDIDTGSVLSISKIFDRSHYVEGHLDQENTIASPNADLRYKRAIKSHFPSIYKINKDLSQDDDMETIGSEQKMMNSLLRKGFDQLYGKDAYIQHLIDNHRDIDRNEEENDMEYENDETDYKEVPSIFETEETWKAHQRQAEARANFIHDEDKDDKNTLGLLIKSPKPSTFPSIYSLVKQISEKKIYKSDPRNKRQSAEIFRSKRDVQKQENPENSKAESESEINNEKDNKLLAYYGQTEPSLKLTTTLSMQSQIPPPLYDSELVKEVIQNQIKTWNMEPSNSTLKETDMNTHLNEEKIKPKVDRKKRQIPIRLNEDRKLSHAKTSHDVKSQHAKFTVEIHAVVDVALYRDFNYNWKTLQKFILHFWQSVNTRFQALVNPQVQLKIKAISKIMFPGFQPFIENNRIKSKSDWVDVDNLLEDFKIYVQKQFELSSLVPDHDVAFLMTGENLCKRKADGSWSKKSRGIAYVRGACISARRFQNETYDVGIAEVGRSFSGVLTATHELAHLLGAFHDGEKSALPCPPSSGYIMGNMWKDPIKFNQFSHCSKLNMKSFLENTWYANCLTEAVDHKNSMTYTFPKELPGQVFSLEEQCYHFMEGVPCQSAPLKNQCGQLCCEKWSQVFKSREPAADGTACGNGMICHGGLCIENVS